MRSKYIKKLKKALYNKHFVIAFLDGFRLKMLYGYAFNHCLDSELDRIYDEALLLETDNPLDVSNPSRTPSLFDIFKASSYFMFPSAATIVDSFSYISLSMGYIFAKTNMPFLLAKYKSDDFNNFLKTKKYTAEYNKSPDTRIVVADSIHDCAFASGETSFMSARLRSQINELNVIVVNQG